MSDYISLNEAAEQLGVSVRTVQRYISDGKLKTKKKGGKKVVAIDNPDTATTTVVKPLTMPYKATETPLPIGGDVEVLKSSLDVLHKQLEIITQQLTVKDKQIDQLASSVQELQTTQRLLIEKAMNLKELGPVTSTVQPLETPTAAEKIQVVETIRPENKTGLYNLVWFLIVLIFLFVGGVVYILLTNNLIKF